MVGDSRERHNYDYDYDYDNNYDFMTISTQELKTTRLNDHD